MQDASRSPVLRYGVAVLSVALVMLLRVFLTPFVGPSMLMLFLLSVTFAAWYGGLLPGLLATALIVPAAVVPLPEPAGRWLTLTDPHDATRLALVSGIGFIISILFQTLRSEVSDRRRAEQASSSQARALTDVMESLAGEHDLEQLEGIVLAAIENQMDAEAGALWSHDEDTDITEVVLDCREGRVTPARTSGHPLAGHRIENRGTPGWDELKASYLRGECLHVPDLQQDTRLAESMRAGLLLLGVKSFLMVPLVLHGRLVGFYSVRSSRLTSYDPGQIKLAQLLAHQATSAIEMSRLVEKTRRAAVLEERNRMAREIHDSLAQAFTGILLQLEAAKRTGRADEHLDNVRALAREGLDEARRSVWALRPQALEAMDLADALARMTEQLNTDVTTRISYCVSGEQRPVPPDVADHMLRVGQEALTNALRHSQANSIVVELSFTVGELLLSVSDDGRGFTDDGLLRKDGFGLNGMRERAALIGAHLTVTSQPNAGTRVDLVWREHPAK